MIAKLSGVLDSIGVDHLVVDVGGVGYLVHCPSRMLQGLPPPGARIAFPVETVVRDDAILLFGFEDAAARDWFRLLQTVQGVGTKAALALLGTLKGDELANAIAARDPASLTRAPGIGRKLAERIVAELKDKAPAPSSLATAARGATVPAHGGSARDAVSALVHLGYRPNEAQAVIGRVAVDLGADAPVEALIRAGLRELAP
ncbi:MAG: Holliday junction branch migration protein RuvA [Alphaproteobacteria bacterium]